MSFSQDQKIDFIFNIALKLAKKKNLLTLSEYLMAYSGITMEDFDNACNQLYEIDEKSGRGEKVSYREFEMAIRQADFSVNQAKCIIGILYSNHQFTDVIESWDSPPIEIKSFMSMVKKYEVKYDLNSID